MFERQSALTIALTSPGHDGPDGGRRLRIGETRGWNLVQISAFSTTLTKLESAMRPLLNVGLPKGVGEAVNIDGWSLFKTGIDQYWIIARHDDDWPRSLSVSVPSNIGSITPLTHSRACIFIEGGVARELLARGIALDFHPDIFRLDQFALTGLHHTPVLIHRVGESRYELYAMRTFALSVWEWLTDAALSFGYEVVARGGV